MLLIKNGRILDPRNNVDMIGDVLIEDGKIKEVAKSITANVDTIDATDMIIAPGLVDMHCHLREPGQEYKENIESGTKAAAHGGFTSVCCMPNTSPVIDNSALVSYIKDKGDKLSYAKVYPIGSISKGMKGSEISEMGFMREAGAIAFSDDGKPVSDAVLMRRALDYSKIFDCLIIAHEEDLTLAHDGDAHEGYYATVSGLKGIPAAAEEVMIARDIILARLTGGRLHVAHTSTRGGVELIRHAKAEGLLVTAEVTPHHLTLTHEAITSFDTATKVNPPLREAEDVKVLCEALIDGTIDCVATDHAPHMEDEKNREYRLAPNGISGFETAFSLLWDKLVCGGMMSASQLIQVMSANPAEILRIDAGSLSVDAPADVIIINPNAEVTIDRNKFYSKGKNTPYHGKTVKGVVKTTILNGKVIVDNGEII